MLSTIKKWLGLPTSPPITKADVEEGTVIDVRSPGEFNGGHLPGSVNIPLDLLGRSSARIKKMDQPIITCCASGMRSAAGAKMLRAQGLDARNGGSWQKVARLMDS
ncbi:sulfurtransferase [Lewinellaceae bacterium SD302]|nr:sulfurtransferase [Lewinellaceae bacterium SD302]